MDDVPVRVKRLAHGRDLELPAYASAGAAGLDLRAAVGHDSPVVLEPGHREVIATGIAVSLPAGFEAQIRPRSGLAVKYGIGVVNAPGTIDADYRGEIKVIVINHGAEPFTIRRGERIAQMVVAPVSHAVLVEVRDLEATARGDGGFGSSGRD